MTKKIHLWIDDSTESDDNVTLGSTLENFDGSRKKLWFRLPVEFRNVCYNSHDSFVLASLFHAMRHSADLVIHGIVSPSLLCNLEEFQLVWNCWRPDVYSRIDINAEIERENERPAGQSAAIAAFSGGVDSCYTLWRHRKGMSGRQQRDVKGALMIHGLDIPLNRENDFELAVQRATKILNSVDVRLITMATNFRDLTKLWEYSHGAAIASCLTLFKHHYSEGLIASSPPYNKLNIMLVWGSNPLTDGLFSSDSFRIVHDGAAYGRHEKVHHLADWPEALDNMRVCWEGEKNDRNCGRCEKCIRTILSFRAAGISLPGSFEKDITDQQIMQLTDLNERKIFDYRQILQYAEKNGVQKSWMTALEKRIRNGGKKNGSKRSWRNILSIKKDRKAKRKTHSVN
jgi:hypothetical protein